jgi:hypothetical protein
METDPNEIRLSVIFNRFPTLSPYIQLGCWNLLVIARDHPQECAHLTSPETLQHATQLMEELTMAQQKYTESNTDCDIPPNEAVRNVLEVCEAAWQCIDCCSCRRKRNRSVLTRLICEIS